MSNCPYACRLWPTSLYCGSEGSCTSDSETPIERCAVTTKTAMQGIVLSACAELGCPIVVLEEIAEECKEHPKKKSESWDAREAFFRVESSVFYERSNSVCRALLEQSCDNADCHHCEGKQSTRCYAFDARMAQYLLDHVDKIRNADETELQKIHTVSLMPLAEDPDFYSETQAKWFYIKNENVIGIRYRCPMSGYSEFAFLLEIENVRGVMILGQILFEDEADKGNALQQKEMVETLLREKAETQYKEKVEKRLREKAETQYKENAAIPNFDDFIAEVANVNLEESFAKNLKIKDSKTEKFISEEVFLRNAATVINNQMKEQLELRMKERYASMRSIIINDGVKEFTTGVAKIEAQFKRDYPDGFDFLPPSHVNDLYKGVCDVFRDVMETDNVTDQKSTQGISLKDYMGLTVRRANLHINPDEFRVSSAEASPIPEDPFEFYDDNKLKYSHYGTLFGNDLSQIAFSDVEYSDPIIQEEKIKKEVQTIFEVIYNRFSLVSEDLRATYLMLYNKAFTASMRHELGQVHQGMLLGMKIYTPRMDWNLRASERWGDEETHRRRRLVDEVHTMRHELGQAHQGMRLDMKIYESRMDLILRALEQWGPVDLERRRLLAKDVRHMQRDFNEYLHESVLRVNSTRYMDLIPKTKIDCFLPYDAFLFKWASIYRRRAEEGMVNFEMMGVALSDTMRPKMYADKDMMEQVAYNLTNNAFKYSRPGTQVCLDCKLSEDGQWYELSVTNYGTTMPDDEFKRICEYGFRGSNHDGNEGSGLGLWHCREIAKNHGGDLIPDMKAISKYDVSAFLLYWLMDKDDQNVVAEYLKKDPAQLRSDLSKEKHLLQEEYADHWQTFNEKLPKISRFTPLYVAKILNRGTAKYSFTVQIPAVQEISVEGSSTDE